MQPQLRNWGMSEKCQTEKSGWSPPTSVVPLKADIQRAVRQVRFVPQPDSCTATKPGRFRIFWSGVQSGEQGLGLFQIDRVETLGEPAVDRREQIMGLLSFALITP
jgi:hypothetical protein